MTAQARLLGGRYQVGELLGYGGMAEVHRGRDLRLGRDVAIKMLRTDLARDATFQARFRREAQNAASLNHPAIVAVYDTGEERGADGESLPYIVMEFVNGRTLKEVLAAEGRFMPRRATEIAADICGALEFSHRHGIIHRDIKPGNVMLTPAGQVKVMDFGIARAVASTTATMTQTSAVIGTAQYLSPEQARGETVDARSDVYATGCVVYELVCGEPPFTGDNPVSVAYQHVREDPHPPSERNPDVTPDVDAVVLKALSKNPANRYQSAAEMRADLLRAANGRPVRATPVLPPDERTQYIAPMPAGGPPTVPASRTDENRRRAAAWVLITLGLLAVFAIAAVGTGLYLANRSVPVTVPDVVGQPEQEARSILTTKQFKVETQPGFSTAEEKGKVVAQSPQASDSAPKGSTVLLTIGAGPKTTTIPNLRGYTKQGAEESLKQNKLKGKFVEVDSELAEGTVVGTDPAAGSKVAEGATVTVQLSNASMISVPDVIGKTQEEATSMLGDFEVQVVPVTTGDAAPGTVTGQEPEAGKPWKKGDTVKIFVRQTEPSPTSSTVTVSPSPPA